MTLLDGRALRVLALVACALGSSDAGWYIVGREGAVHGPYALESLQYWATNGDLQPEDMIAQDAAGPFVAARVLAGTASEAAPAPAPAEQLPGGPTRGEAPGAPPPPAARRRLGSLSDGPRPRHRGPVDGGALAEPPPQQQWDEWSQPPVPGAPRRRATRAPHSRARGERRRSRAHGQKRRRNRARPEAPRSSARAGGAAATGRVGEAPPRQARGRRPPPAHRRRAAQEEGLVRHLRVHRWRVVRKGVALVQTGVAAAVEKAGDMRRAAARTHSAARATTRTTRGPPR